LITNNGKVFIWGLDYRGVMVFVDCRYPYGDRSGFPEMPFSCKEGEHLVRIDNKFRSIDDLIKFLEAAKVQCDSVSGMQLVGQNLALISGIQNFPNLRSFSLYRGSYHISCTFSSIEELDHYDIFEESIPDHSETVDDIYPRLDISPLTAITSLEHLDLSDRYISNIQKIRRLINLKHLVLNETRTFHLSFLTYLNHLEHLELCNNAISDLTPIGSLSHLRYLDLGNKNPLGTEKAAGETMNHISRINGIGGIISLENLNLCHNQIVELSGIENLIQLRFLDLSDNNLEDISNLASLHELQELRIKGNNISDISALHRLKNLVRLDLSHNKGISSIYALRNLLDLERLNLSATHVRRIGSLRHLKRLKYLDLGFNNIRDISPLSQLEDLQELYLSTNRISNLEPLANLTSLKILQLSTSRISDLGSIAGLSNMELLHLYHCRISDISAFRNFPKLRQLVLGFNHFRGPLRFDYHLDLERLDLSINEISAIYDIGYFSALKILDLSQNRISEITGIEGLINLRSINLSENKLASIPDFRNCVKLIRVDMKENLISSISGLENLIEMRHLDLSHNQIDQIDNLENLSRLKSIDLSSNRIGIDGLEKLLHYRLNGHLPKLHSVDLTSNSINPLFDVLNGKSPYDYVDELKKLGVDVKIDKVTYHTPKMKFQDLADGVLSVIDPEYKLSDFDRYALIEAIIKNGLYIEEHLNEIDDADGGFTSQKAFKCGKKFFKLDRLSRLSHEMKFYEADSGEFMYYRVRRNEDGPQLLDEGNVGVLIMDNMDLYIPAVEQLAKDYGPLFFRRFGKTFNQASTTYRLLLMSIFHKEMSKHFDTFNPIQYAGVHGLPHFEEGAIPSANKDDIGIRKLIETSIPSGSVRHIIIDYIQMRNSISRTIIHGDWKPENFVNGYVVDYSLVGRGLEVDELAYAMSDSRSGMTKEKFHRTVDLYCDLRSMHDFVSLSDPTLIRRNMHLMADSALLSQLVLRHSVMNKRDMNDPEKYKQRVYYQQAVLSLLKDGRFGQ